MWIPPLPPHVHQQQQEGGTGWTVAATVLGGLWVLGFLLGILAFRV